MPLLNASLTDCVFEMERATTVEEVNGLFAAWAEGPLQGILGFEPRPLVSADFLNDPRSAIIDGPSTMVVNGTQVKVFAWYDNEWGYACRLADVTRLVAEGDVMVEARAARPRASRPMPPSPAAYWAFMLTDGALRMLVLLHFNRLGFTPIQLAYLFLLYEIAGDRHQSLRRLDRGALRADLDALCRARAADRRAGGAGAARSVLGGRRPRSSSSWRCRASRASPRTSPR